MEAGLCEGVGQKVFSIPDSALFSMPMEICLTILALLQKQGQRPMP
jgi:hypothetical protein